MALDVPKPLGHKKAWRAGINLTRIVTVCDSCRCASCWHGKFYCDNARMSGTADVMLATLMHDRRENEEYWFTDSATGVIDHTTLATFRRTYPEACSQVTVEAKS